MKSVLAADEQLFLLDNANLSTGGDAVDVTETMHAGFKEIAINLTRDMGLRICGVDIMVDGDISKSPRKYHIIETNAAPGLDHYVRSGPAQKKIVEDLYRAVLIAMTRQILIYFKIKGPPIMETLRLFLPRLEQYYRDLYSENR